MSYIRLLLVALSFLNLDLFFKDRKSSNSITHLPTPKIQAQSSGVVADTTK